MLSNLGDGGRTRTGKRPPLAGGAPLRTAALIGSAVLLLSMGGAIVAAPLSLPLLAWTARSTPSRTNRVFAVVLAALTAAEVGWAAAYVTLGDSWPWIVLLPIVAGLAAGTTVLRRARP